MFQFSNSLHSLDFKISFKITFLVLFWFGLFFRFFNSYLLHIQNIFIIYLLFFLLFFAFFTNKKNVKSFIEFIADEEFLIKANRIENFLNLNSKLSLFLGFYIFFYIEPLFYSFKNNEIVSKGIVLFFSMYKISIFLCFSLEKFFASAVFKEYYSLYFHRSRPNLGAPVVETLWNSVMHGVPKLTKEIISGFILTAGGVFVTTKKGAETREKAHQKLDQANENAIQQIEKCDHEIEILENSKKMELTSVARQVKDFRGKSKSNTLGQQELEKLPENQSQLDFVSKKQDDFAEHSEKAQHLIQRVYQEKARLDTTSDFKVGLKEVGFFFGEPEFTGSVMHRARNLKQEVEELSLDPQLHSSLRQISSVLELFFF